MISIASLGNLGAKGASARLAANYYENKSSDYYLKGSEKSGEWLGDGAKRLDLIGEVERDDFQLALAGFTPGNKVQNAGDKNRQMGWDTTFSAPKSVSILWAFSDERTRAMIEKAHAESVREAFRYLEENSFARIGKGGYRTAKADPLAAMFTHYTSRAGDPLLHSHIVIANIGVRKDGTVNTINSKVFYTHRLTAGYLYQTNFASIMRAEGYEVEPGKKGTFRLKGVPREIEDTFSKRAVGIKQRAMELFGKEDTITTHAVARDRSRPKKMHTSLTEMEKTWRGEARGLGFKIDVSKENLYPAEHKDFVGEATRQITAHISTFKDRDLVREIAKSGMGQLYAREVLKLTQEAKEKGRVTKLSKDALSTNEMIKIEKKMETLAKTMAAEKGHGVRPKIPERLPNGEPFSDEQKAAVRCACAGAGIAVIQGRAGTGKSTMLAAVRESYESAGYRVAGLAVTAQAAKTLEESSGIRSQTIASWQIDKRKSINSKTIFIVDEAGLVGSKAMTNILEETWGNNAKTIPVGDERQLATLSAGGALHAVDKAVRNVNPEISSAMENIIRQKEKWMRETVTEASRGKSAKALDNLDHHKKVHIYQDAGGARSALVDKYLEKESNHEKSVAILTHRIADANRINEEIRNRLQAKGSVSKNKLTIDNGQREIKLAEGDRIFLTKNEYHGHGEDRELYVGNGDRASVEKIDQERLTLRMDDGEEKQIDTEKYPHIDYGWARNIHKVQSITVERAYIFSHGTDHMASKESFYVQISRSKEETNLYIARGEGGIEREDPAPSPEISGKERESVLEEMKKTLERSEAKDTTLDYEMDKHQEKERAVEVELGIGR